MRFEVFVPILPERALSPNRRPHWSAKASAKKSLMGFVAIYVSEAFTGDAIDPADLDIDLRVCRKRPPPGDDYYRPKDVDNAVASLKAAIDGLVVAGVIIDDKRKHMRLRDVDLVTVPSHDDEGIHFVVELVED
jgi:hypothetical protein